jgi:hypothetical protein
MTRFRPILLPAACVTLLFILITPAAGDDAYVKRSEAGIALGNDHLELFFTATANRCTASVLSNKLAGKTHPLVQDSFTLGVAGRDPVSTQEFEIMEIRSSAVPEGQSLVFEMRHSAGDINLELIYELGDGDFFMRRRIEASVNRPLNLRTVDVWIAGIEGACSHQGYGEPVFLEDTFWGLEYPGGDNRYTEGKVALTHYPGRTIHDHFKSKTAVVGVAEPGRITSRFRQYVHSFQATPGTLPLFVNYNTWWTLMPPTEKNCLALIDIFKQELFDPFQEQSLGDPVRPVSRGLQAADRTPGIDERRPGIVALALVRVRPCTLAGHAWIRAEHPSSLYLPVRPQLPQGHREACHRTGQGI